LLLGGSQGRWVSAHAETRSMPDYSGDSGRCQSDPHQVFIR
jgi:hypothetical protein